ncbi:mediator of RNA polymerase II transcription subunit 18 [Phlebotomus argentipes]|uniref:mediator of RNA polymerase II transcription subunit 18 n=1 Tax=Phlebotomus argentipes TaxID=94469 RepID=UPI0028937C71|nr:mediator of RNA polymerase II transcription subunit 18 [Phlebotomus argentipes]XP_059619680.1 mediator of RNA polymerase II transcription subunit 18 [Phlebotomus argentipes]
MSAPNAPITTVESLSHALKCNIIPNQEYLLQGSILDSQVEHLLHRLKGLCDNVDSGPEPFHDHEICFSLRGQNQNQQLQLRVRKAQDIDAPYQLRYIGQPEVGDRSRPTLIRSSIDISCTASVLEFLTELGCRIDFEYANRGYMFRKGRMKITVSKIFKVGGLQPTDPISQSYLVELSILAPSGQDVIGEEMRILAEQLKPLVQLEKIDYKRAL